MLTSRGTPRVAASEDPRRPSISSRWLCGFPTPVRSLALSLSRNVGLRGEAALGLPAGAALPVMAPGSLSFSTLESGCSRGRGPAFAQAVGAGGRNRNSCGTLVSVSEEYRTGRRLLGSEDAPFMPHRSPAGQPFQDLHRHPGIAGAFRTWQQLEGMQLEPHRVVPGHFPAVFEAQDLVQAQLRVQRPECRLRTLGPKVTSGA